MNVLFQIGSYDSFGGTEKITTVLANAFLDALSDGTGPSAVIIAAVRGHCEPAKLGLDPRVRCIDLGGLKDPAVLRRALVENRIEVILNQWCLPFYVTRYINQARRGLSVRLVSVLHGVPDRSKAVICAEDAVKAAHGFGRLVARAKLWAVDRVIRASIRFVYRRSDAYVVLSDGFKESFRAYTGLKDTPKLTAIGNPVTIRDEIGDGPIPEKRRQVLYVGRMDKENKRVNRIVEAWARVAGEAVAAGWELVLVGDGPHKHELEAQVRDGGVPRVRFEGFVADAVPYYRDAAIFMLTSDLEGFGLVLVECMTYGVVPIVYGSYVSVYDIIDDGVSGFITPTPYSAETTAARLKTLMADESLRRKMSVAAREKAKAFSLERILERWRMLFESGGREI